MAARSLRSITLVLAICLSILTWAVPPARANSLCVNMGGTGGCFGTIAAAISAAGPGDTIHIAGGSPYLERLTIAKSLNLAGDDAATTIIDGASLGQVLRITGTITVSLTNLTIRDGHSGLGDTLDQWGGGIHNELATLTLNDVIVTFNQTGGDNLCCAGNGGGIYSRNATVTLNHSTVSFNSTAAPGPHVPDGYNGGDGGGIFNDHGTVILNDSTVSGNVTGSGSDGATNGGFGGYGGGVDSFDGLLTLNRSSISGNVTGNGGSGTFGGPGGGGGGVFDDMGRLTINASTISGNKTGVGGSGGSAFGASGVGGGIFINGTGGFVANLVDISNTTISANATGQGLSGSRNGNGGGIFAQFANPINITNTTLAFNTIDPGQQGGGIANTLGTVTLKNSLLAFNRTTSGPTSLTDCSGTLTSLGYNAILEPFCTITPTVGDQFFLVGITVAPLANNGGPTLTNALPPGSLAIDAGDNSTCSPTD
jgi:hypothetical protein